MFHRYRLCDSGSLIPLLLHHRLALPILPAEEDVLTISQPSSTQAKHRQEFLPSAGYSFHPELLLWSGVANRE
jgi:hypothetical protein